MMCIVEIFKITFLTDPIFSGILIDLCIIIDYIVKVAAEPGIYEYEGAIFAFFYAEGRIHIYSKGIEVVITFPVIAEKLTRCWLPYGFESSPIAYGTVDIYEDIFHNILIFIDFLLTGCLLCKTNFQIEYVEFFCSMCSDR